jgi:hypothetical protein
VKRKFILLPFASCCPNIFSFKVTEVALMMDWEDSSGSSGNEDESKNIWNLHEAASNLQETGSAGTRGSMRGLQMALAEGWLIQRARDMCSFAHDRYRQAAQAVAEALPEESIAKMFFRVISTHLIYAVLIKLHLADYSNDAPRNSGRCLSNC